MTTVPLCTGNSRWRAVPRHASCMVGERQHCAKERSSGAASCDRVGSRHCHSADDALTQVPYAWTATSGPLSVRHLSRRQRIRIHILLRLLVYAATNVTSSYDRATQIQRYATLAVIVQGDASAPACATTTGMAGGALSVLPRRAFSRGGMPFACVANLTARRK